MCLPRAFPRTYTLVNTSSREMRFLGGMVLGVARRALVAPIKAAQHALVRSTGVKGQSKVPGRPDPLSPVNSWRIAAYDPETVEEDLSDDAPLDNVDNRVEAAVEPIAPTALVATLPLLTTPATAASSAPRSPLRLTPADHTGKAHGKGPTNYSKDMPLAIRLLEDEAAKTHKHQTMCLRYAHWMEHKRQYAERSSNQPTMKGSKSAPLAPTTGTESKVDCLALFLDDERSTAPPPWLAKSTPAKVLDSFSSAAEVQELEFGVPASSRAEALRALCRVNLW